MFIGESIGPFQIERELGSGAMGTVYRAVYEKEHGPKKIVAIKIISFGLTTNEGAMARFNRESKILEQLRHPNIVRLVGTGRYKKTPFIAMEYVDGEALDRILDRRKRLGWEEVVGYMKQLCAALQCAHDAGIIHRDLKPSNLMITRDGTLKLTDFGIAKDQDVTALTGANSTIGTAAYMSPEQCKGDKHLSGRSDLYSLGIVMYELITGRKPFTADTTVDMFLKHVNDKPPRPTRIVPDLPVWLETLMLHLLEKDKDKRPLDAETVGRMLEEIELKVAAQESAGLNAANARRSDRGRGVDDEDKEAARSLRSGKRKKKKKDVATTPVWLKFAPPIAGLLAIAGILFVIFKPESQEKLFAKVASAETAEKKIEEARKFIEQFGTDGGEHVEKAKVILKEARGQKLDGILEVRFRTQKIRTAQENEDAENYAAAWSALEAELKGEMVQAAAFWNKVKARAPQVKDDYAEGWGWLADKHLTDISRCDEAVKQIRKELEQRNIHETEWAVKFDDPHALATLAIRLGGVGGQKAAGISEKAIPFLKDDGKVAKAWTDLADLTKEKPELRSWFLLAVREKKNYSEIKPESALEIRKTNLAAQLERIRLHWLQVENDPNMETSRRDCRNRARDITECYSDELDPAVKKTVDETRRLLSTMMSKKGS